MIVTPILIKDDTIAISNLIHSVGDVVVEWPYQAGYTPYGYFIPVNNSSANILDYLEYGAHAGYEDTEVKSYGTRPSPEDDGHIFRGMIIDHLGRVFLLEMPSQEWKEDRVRLYKFRILTGEGAKFVLADTVVEHERAIFSMRLKDTMEDALALYLDNSSMFQYRYEVFDIPAIAAELAEMGYTLPLP